MKVAEYWHLDGDKVVCDLCPHGCRLSDGQRGICHSRLNNGGVMYAEAYGLLCSVANDPIEKKPLYHFHPGSRCLSVASAGCNLHCRNCQNYEISQVRPHDIDYVEATPEGLVGRCVALRLPTIAYTYTEPLTWFEFVYDSSLIAHERGIYNVLVSAGYVNEQPLRELAPLLDAANIDLKSFSDKVYHQLNGASLKPVLRSLEILKDAEVELEITNLLIPGYNDDTVMIKNMCKWLVENGFGNSPLHFSRFFPMYKLSDAVATPLSTMRKAQDIAQDAGMKYVYLGNV